MPSFSLQTSGISRARRRKIRWGSDSKEDAAGATVLRISPHQKQSLFTSKKSPRSLDLKLWFQVRQPLVEDPQNHCSVKAVSLSFLFYVVIVRIREIPARNSAHDPSPLLQNTSKDSGGKKKRQTPLVSILSLSRWLPLCPGQRDGERENPFGRP